ncbi:LacI family DNA-binding transcriptional regulator [Halanaerocella petrolearia]
MKITMKEIAQEADVSKATVSRVINNDKHVREETRKKVMKVVEKYNYKPHTVAQGLARNLSHTIAVMVPSPPRNITDPFFLEFLHGVGNTAAEYNYSISLPTVSDDDEEKLYQQVIDNKQIDGLIITDPKVDDSRVDYLKEQGISSVFLGRTLDQQDVCWVDADNVGGSYQATEYLIEQGYKEIACISGGADFVASHTRLEGYKQALSDNDITFKSRLVEEGNYTRDSGYSAMKKLLSKDVYFSAVFAINDPMAMGAIQALKESDIKVPDECAVMGFDGIDLGTYIEPQLSTIRQPVYQLGREIVEMLIKLIRDKEIRKSHKVLPVELLLRNSV